MKLSRIVFAGFLALVTLALYWLLRPSAEKAIALPTPDRMRPTAERVVTREKIPAQSQSRPSTTSPKATEPLSTAADWKYRGNSTPDAAFESVLWAKAQNNILILSNLISMSPQLRAKADHALSKLNAVSRNRYSINTPEQLIAFSYAVTPEVDDYRVLSVAEGDESNATVTGDIKIEGMKDPMTIRIPLHYESGGWRYVFEEEMASDLIDRLFGPGAN